MNLFEAVKQNVTTRQAAERYGIRIRRNGMAVCPFHNDKNPSMKLDRRFHCFGCQADGDAVDRSGNRRFLPIMVHPENAEIHILEDEAASRAFIDMMWAEVMFI